MSSFPRRPSGAGSSRGLARSLIHWLTGSVLAGSSLSAALPARSSQPYLATISPLPLRFAPPPPDVSTEPPPAAPPNPDGVIGEVVQSNLEAAVALPAREETPEPASSPPEPATPESPSAVNGPAPNRPPVEIIPDDLQPEVRPEDVLPFFLPPQLPSAPPSQATYRQR